MTHKFTKGDVSISYSAADHTGKLRMRHGTVQGLRCGWLAITPTLSTGPDGELIGKRGTRNVTHIPTGCLMSPPPAGVYGIIAPYSLAAYRLWVGCLIDAEPAPDWWANLGERNQVGLCTTMARARELYVAAVARMVCGDPTPEVQP